MTSICLETHIALHIGNLDIAWKEMASMLNLLLRDTLVQLLQVSLGDSLGVDLLDVGNMTLSDGIST